MSVLNYTGPITIVEFIGNRDSFFFTFKPNVDDEDAIAKIVDKFAEDGYKPNPKGVDRSWYMIDGELQERAQNKGWKPAAYKRMSAFLRV